MSCLFCLDFIDALSTSLLSASEYFEKGLIKTARSDVAEDPASKRVTRDELVTELCA